MIGAFFGFGKHIVNIGRSDILQAKRHYIVVVVPVWCNKGRFLHFMRVHRNLVVDGESVQK